MASNPNYDPFEQIMPLWKRLIILFLTLPIALILGTIGYMDYLSDENVTFSNALYHAVQLFFVHAPHFERPVPVCLEIARFLAATSTILIVFIAVMYLFRFQRELFKIRRMKGHIILCGLGEIGFALVSNYPDKKKIVVIEKDIYNENISKLKKQGVKFYEGNAMDPEILKRMRLDQAKALYALTGDDFSNLTIIKNVMKLFSDKQCGNPQLKLAANIDRLNLNTAAKQEISLCKRPDCVIQSNLRHFKEQAENILKQLKDHNVADEELWKEYKNAKEILENYDPDNSRDAFDQCQQIRYFNINELAARSVFHRYPPDRFKPVYASDNPPVHILMLGHSQIGEELFKQIVQNCHYINRKKTKVTHLSLDAETFKEKVRNKCTHLDQSVDLAFVQLNPNHITHTLKEELQLNDVDVIYICADQDTYQASYTIKAREVFGEKKSIIRWFTRYVFSQDPNNTMNVYTIEVINDLAKEAIIINEKLDKQAKATHHQWMKQAIDDYINSVEKNLQEKAEIPLFKETLVPWHMLDEEIRDDNRTAVEHNYLKIRTAGYLRKPDDYDFPEKASVHFSFIRYNKIVQELAEMEHRRWMATKFYYGWRPGSRIKELKMHDDLKDFSELPDTTKDYDIKQLLNLPNVFIIDYEGTIRDKPFNEFIIRKINESGSWQHYKKTKPIWAKKLEEEVAVNTLEGKITCPAGDYLCKGHSGDVWCQEEEALFKKYDLDAETAKDKEGFLRYIPKPDASGVMAAPVDSDFEIKHPKWDIFKGVAGDYLVKSYDDKDVEFPNDVWIVKKAIFEETYEVVK